MMGARVKMAPQALTKEMLLLIEARAEESEVFTLPGKTVAQMALWARRGLAETPVRMPAEASVRETLIPDSRRAVVDLEKLELWEAARNTVRFLSSEQREALKRALSQ